MISLDLIALQAVILAPPSSRTPQAIRDRVRIKCWILNLVIPAKAGIHRRRRLKEGEQRRASSCFVSGYGSRALLRSPGMTVLHPVSDPGSALTLRPG